MNDDDGVGAADGDDDDDKVQAGESKGMMASSRRPHRPHAHKPVYSTKRSDKRRESK